ncbi:dihydroneopterin aldolase [Neptuniibacter caesariensis]|uniref:7,8-dihydroneopterin aldolase n=1 Tax=Neptuniibacter caesariensis TaxID=207954 RepID=A0A7U8C448_NEPCE|nr:dihydroneopterin aldolase [Neptuniibacter caesariensis]EAR60884.1 dihydroneopterin aldolase [Oceanospirillum sp. MED92] [Neptuniibacter caesariensis]
MDIVYIRELEVETVIGIYDWEREIRQRVNLDLEMGTDIRQAANTEDVENTLNYKTVSDRLIDFISQSEFLLVETMAEQIAELVKEEFSVKWLRLRLGKPGAVPAAQDVGVIIERGERW